MLADRGANLALRPDDVPAPAPGGHLHLSGYTLLDPRPRGRRPRARSRAAVGGRVHRLGRPGVHRTARARTASTGGWPTRRGATLLLPNADEARLLTGCARRRRTPPGRWPRRHPVVAVQPRRRRRAVGLGRRAGAPAGAPDDRRRHHRRRATRSPPGCWRPGSARPAGDPAAALDAGLARAAAVVRRPGRPLSGQPSMTRAGPGLQHPVGPGVVAVRRRTPLLRRPVVGHDHGDPRQHGAEDREDQHQPDDLVEDRGQDEADAADAHRDRVALLPGGVLLGQARLRLGDQHRLGPCAAAGTAGSRPRASIPSADRCRRGPPRLLPVLAPSCHRGRPVRVPGAHVPAGCFAALAACFCSCLKARTSASDSGPGDVGDRAARALQAVVAGRLPPAGRGDAVLLAEQREEDLRLLRAEARQLAQPAQQRGAVRGVGPQVLRRGRRSARPAAGTAPGCGRPSSPGSGAAPAAPGRPGRAPRGRRRRGRAADRLSTPSRSASSRGAPKARSIGNCWSSSIPISSASGSRPSSSSAAASWAMVRLGTRAVCRTIRGRPTEGPAPPARRPATSRRHWVVSLRRRGRRRPGGAPPRSPRAGRANCDRCSSRWAISCRQRAVSMVRSRSRSSGRRSMPWSSSSSLVGTMPTGVCRPVTSPLRSCISHSSGRRLSR